MHKIKRLINQLKSKSPSEPKPDLDKPVSWYDLMCDCIEEILKTKTPSELKKTKSDFLREILESIGSHNITSYIDNELRYDGKSAFLSEDYFDNGMFYCNSSNNPETYDLDIAYDELTKSITNAPPDSLELALGYAGRSEVLFKSRLLHDAIEDIKRALSIEKCPDEYKAELFIRRANCYKGLGRGMWLGAQTSKATKYLHYLNEDEQFEFKNKIREIESGKNINRTIYQKTKPINDALMANLIDSDDNGENEIIDLMRVEFNEKYGRHYVADRDIEPGTTLIADEPYVAILCGTVRYKYCWHCKIQIWSSIPCYSCSKVVFCTEKCRSAALKEYHDMECPVMDFLLTYTEDTHLLVALMLTIRAFNEADRSIYKLEKIIKTFDIIPELSENNNSSFERIWKLSTNKKLIKQTESYYLTYSILIAYLLTTRTSIFVDEKPSHDFLVLKNNKRFLFLVKFIKKIINIVHVNSFIHNRSKKLGDPEKFIHILTYGMSLFNHKCYSELIRIWQNGMMIVKTLMPIKKNEQIFMNYGPMCFTENYDERQNYLKEHYNFVCECDACFYRWPMKRVQQEPPDELSNVYEKIKLDLSSVLENIRNSARSIYCDTRLTHEKIKYSHSIDDYFIIIKCIQFFDRYFDRNSIDIGNSKKCLGILLHLCQTPHMLLMNYGKSSEEFKPI